jgi:hypothetical protein
LIKKKIKDNPQNLLDDFNKNFDLLVHSDEKPDFERSENTIVANVYNEEVISSTTIIKLVNPELLSRIRDFQYLSLPIMKEFISRENVAGFSKYLSFDQVSQTNFLNFYRLHSHAPLTL